MTRLPPSWRLRPTSLAMKRLPSMRLLVPVTRIPAAIPTVPFVLELLFTTRQALPTRIPSPTLEVVMQSLIVEFVSPEIPAPPLKLELHERTVVPEFPTIPSFVLL